MYHKNEKKEAISSRLIRRILRHIYKYISKPFPPASVPFGMLVYGTVPLSMPADAMSVRLALGLIPLGPVAHSPFGRPEKEKNGKEERRQKEEKTKRRKKYIHRTTKRSSPVRMTDHATGPNRKEENMQDANRSGQ